MDKLYYLPKSLNRENTTSNNGYTFDVGEDGFVFKFEGDTIYQIQNNLINGLEDLELSKKLIMGDWEHSQDATNYYIKHGSTPAIRLKSDGSSVLYDVQTNNITPPTTNTYDIGSSLYRYDKIWSNDMDVNSLTINTSLTLPNVVNITTANITTANIANTNAGNLTLSNDMDGGGFSIENVDSLSANTLISSALNSGVSALTITNSSATNTGNFICNGVVIGDSYVVSRNSGALVGGIKLLDDGNLKINRLWSDETTGTDDIELKSGRIDLNNDVYITGELNMIGEIVPDVDNTRELGSASKMFNITYSNSISINNILSENGSLVIDTSGSILDITTGSLRIKSNNEFAQLSYDSLTTDYTGSSPFVLDFGRDGLSNNDVMVSSRFGDLAKEDYVYVSTDTVRKEFYFYDTTLTKKYIMDKDSIYPAVDGAVDLGTATNKFGTMYIDSLNIGTLETTDITPETSNTYDIGTSSKLYKDIYCNKIYTTSMDILNIYAVGSGTFSSTILNDMTINSGDLVISSGDLEVGDTVISTDSIETTLSGSTPFTITYNRSSFINNDVLISTVISTEAKEDWKYNFTNGIIKEFYFKDTTLTSKYELDKNNFRPTTDADVDLGSSTKKFGNVYADNFNGVLVNEGFKTIQFTYDIVSTQTNENSFATLTMDNTQKQVLTVKIDVIGLYNDYYHIEYRVYGDGTNFISKLVPYTVEASDRLPSCGVVATNTISSNTLTFLYNASSATTDTTAKVFFTISGNGDFSIA